MPKRTKESSQIQRITGQLAGARSRLASNRGNDTQKLWDSIIARFPDGINGLAGVIVAGATGPNDFSRQQVLKLITSVGISRTAAAEKAGRLEDDVDEEDIIWVLKNKILNDLGDEDAADTLSGPADSEAP